MHLIYIFVLCLWTCGAYSPIPNCHYTTPSYRGCGIRKVVDAYFDPETRYETEFEYGPIEDWRTGHVMYMSYLFRDNVEFNKDISGWDVSSVVDFHSMFRNASSFNQPIGIWKTINAKDMRSMFSGASSFNQPLDKWPTKQVRWSDKIFDGSAMRYWSAFGGGAARALYSGVNAYGCADICTASGVCGLMCASHDWPEAMNKDITDWQKKGLKGLSRLSESISCESESDFDYESCGNVRGVEVFPILGNVYQCQEGKDCSKEDDEDFCEVVCGNVDGFTAGISSAISSDCSKEDEEVVGDSVWLYTSVCKDEWDNLI